LKHATHFIISTNYRIQLALLCKFSQINRIFGESLFLPLSILLVNILTPTNFLNRLLDFAFV
jgi:hypothetical protein